MEDGEQVKRMSGKFFKVQIQISKLNCALKVINMKSNWVGNGIRMWKTFYFSGFIINIKNMNRRE